MNKIEKILVNIATKIKNREDKKFKSIQISKDDVRQTYLNTAKLIKDNLWLVLKPIEHEMLKKQCHFNVGDTVILNKYELEFNSNNNWDLGSSQLLRHIDENEVLSPVLVKITNFNIHTGFAEEQMDKFIEKLDNIELLYKASKSPTYALNLFKNHIKHLDLDWINDYGLYKEALFHTTNISFKPSWGLNIKSFHNLESDAGQLTLTLWKEEGDLYKNWIESKDKYNEFKIKLENQIYAFNL